MVAAMPINCMLVPFHSHRFERMTAYEMNPVSAGRNGATTPM